MPVMHWWVKEDWRVNHAWIAKEFYLHALLGKSVFASGIKWMRKLNDLAPEAEDKKKIVLFFYKIQRKTVTWNAIIRIQSCETPALVRAAFVWFQLPVASAYLSPLVMVFALIANSRLASFPLSIHCTIQRVLEAWDSWHFSGKKKRLFIYLFEKKGCFHAHANFMIIS